MKTTCGWAKPVSAALLALALTGCVPSINPLYTEADLIYDPDLEGEWAEKETSKERWTFAPAGEKAYQVTYSDGEKSGKFEVRLLKLGERRFLDFFPDSKAMDEMAANDFYRAHWVPAHMFAQLYGVTPVLRMAFMDPDWMKEHLEKEPGSLAHAREGREAAVLTASTRELQAFVTKHAASAFGDESDRSELQRVPKR